MYSPKPSFYEGVFKMRAENGDTVKVSYTGKHENGEVFDTSDKEKAKEAGVHVPGREYVPLEIEVGAAQVIKGFDDALIGMKAGEEKEVKVPPEKGYGDRKEELVQDLPREIFTQNKVEPVEGMRINTNQGLAEIINVGKEDVKLDFNHPLAGKTIYFEIKVEELKKA